MTHRFPIWMPPQSCWGALLLSLIFGGALACQDADLESASPDATASSGGVPELDASQDAEGLDASVSEDAPWDDDLGGEASEMAQMPDLPPPAEKGRRARICEGFEPGADAAPVVSGQKILASGGRTPEGVDVPFDFLEGPVWSESRGRLYFNDFNTKSPLNSDSMGPPSVLYEFDPRTGQVLTLLEGGVVRANGMAIDEEGRLVLAAHDLREVATLDLETKVRVTVSSTYQGKAYNSPNDLVVSTAGGIYFTDPAYNGQVDGRDRELDFEGVFWIPPGGESVLVDRALGRPNGITLSPDERTLYVASRADHKVWTYELGEGGAPGPATVFLDGPSADGVAMDCAGFLYLAVPGKGVDIYAPQGGARLKRISARAITNLAFGGADFKTLYVTEKGRLLSFDTTHPGFPY